MIETPELRYKEPSETLSPIQPYPTKYNTGAHHRQNPTYLLVSPRFIEGARFILVGGLNTTLDLLALNSLLFLFPTGNRLLILIYTVLAYSIGAANSFLLNKYWTFKHRQRTTPREIGRFTITTLFGIGWNAALIWLASTIAHPFPTNAVLWTNASKIVAIGSGAFISFLGMRLWVFVSTPHSR